MKNNDDLNFPISNHILLIGMVGAGKTSIGKKLAECLGLEFKDLEDEIVKATNNSIEEIYTYWGEDVFREFETDVLNKLLKQPIHVLATGDSTFNFNKDVILDNCLSIWINPDLNLIKSRISNRSNKSNLNSDMDSIISLYIEKEAVYSQANISVYTQDFPYKSIVDKIILYIKEYVTYGKVLNVDNNKNDILAKDYLKRMKAASKNEDLTKTSDELKAEQDTSADSELKKK